MSAIFLGLHITAGIVGLIAGFTVIFLQKGSVTHKNTGWVFLLAMLVLGLTGSIIAYAKHIPLSMLNGMLLCYLLLTSLTTIRAASSVSALLNKALFGLAATLVAGYGYYFYLAIGVSPAKLAGFGPAAYAVFGVITVYALAEDIVVLCSERLSSRMTLIRHLWRMLFVLFMATAAVFLGQAKLFPAPLVQSGAIFVPVVFVLLSLFYWLFKVLFKKQIIKN
ncbi:MAG: hypothetical protein KKE30_18745 [Gammaproteobacteria bacterium]|nr:hypothetical protein [Gammaproteobacteria bacterium]MBU1553513.1 hypothetical protein [Gammaproteobacteria bacterium]MBU2069279.1 hypothetical protein [Gammaproteobacteria bacterium]MBU2183274.1 hypothetical protein [Gammaproteobacteria bacterium]MBU2204489.1 hypothetical protein [Gammaproteobacteria bacterium]